MVGRRLREQNLVSRTVYLWLNPALTRKGGVNGPEIGNFGAQKTYKSLSMMGMKLALDALK
jgi:hypothetical protein